MNKSPMMNRRTIVAGLTIAIAGLLVMMQPMSGEAQPTSKAQLAPGLERAIFAGGCFWCMEPPYDALDGVSSTISGYIGGSEVNPTYRQVSAGATGHTEAVEVIFDPTRVSYKKLLDVFWVNVDPTQADRQFCDRGSQYRPGIFPTSPEQRVAALASLAELNENKPFKEPVVVEITDATDFYPAETYHQDYYLKNPIRYKFYRTGCRRDARLKTLWGDRAGGD